MCNAGVKPFHCHFHPVVQANGHIGTLFDTNLLNPNAATKFHCELMLRCGPSSPPAVNSIRDSDVFVGSGCQSAGAGAGACAVCV